MSVEMALAEATHHTAPRGQKNARAREEERETKYTAEFRATVPPPEPEPFDLFEEPGGRRPNLLLEPQGPQAGIQRHTMEHIADVVPMVQILDIPVLLGADQLVEVGRHLDFLIPEQVIEVPKISLDKVPRHRMVDLAHPPQMAEQLVEVPTIISYSMLRTIEQTMDIPVPRVRGEVAEVYKVFIQDRVFQQRVWSRSLNFQFLSVGGRELEVFKVFSLDRIQQRTWSRTLTFRLVVVFTVSSQDKVLPHRVDFLAALMRDFQGVFALFPVRKKVRGGVRTRGRNWVRTLPMDSGGLCRVQGGRLRRGCGVGGGGGGRGGDGGDGRGGSLSCWFPAQTGLRAPMATWPGGVVWRCSGGGGVVELTEAALSAFSPGVGAHHTGDEPM